MSETARHSLPRLYVPHDKFDAGATVGLTDGQHHYLRNVMRAERGQGLRLFNGRDGEWLATLDVLDKKNAIARLERQTRPQQVSPDITVLAAVTKKEAFELMVEKACELGARDFVPVVTQHTVVHRINQERLQAIATEAAEQSERTDVMTVHPLVPLTEVLAAWPAGRPLLFCLERASAPPLAEILTKPPLGLLVGPEGGFSEAETERVAKHPQTRPASLGGRILRAETALVAALAVIQQLTEK